MERESIPMVSSHARTWAMACHLAALIGWLGNGIGFILGPLAVWLIKRNEDPFIDDQGKEALNFQITMLIAFAVAAVLALVLVGFALLAVLALAEIVFPILAAVRANEGKRFRYPLTLRLIR